VLVDEDAGGDVGGEIAFGVADDDFEEALQGTWANNPAIVVVTADTEISDVSATTLTVAAGGAAFVAAMLTYMSGFPSPANNKLARVSASTAATIVYPAATFAAETAPIPVGATVRQVGFEGAASDLAAVTEGGNGLQSTELDFTTLGLSPGRWVKVGDGDNAGHSLATAADNGFCRISAGAAHKLSFDVVPTGWATVDIEQGAIATYTKTYVGKSASITPVCAPGATDVPAPTFWRAQHLVQCRPHRIRRIGHHRAEFRASRLFQHHQQSARP